MPIGAGDIQKRLSGGAANTDPNASLGGAISNTAVVAASVENLFDNVSGDEGAAGDVEYRCLYWRNNHGTLTWTNVTAWIETETPSVSTEVAIAVDGVGINGTAEVVANEQSAPAGEAFSRPLDKAGGIAIGDIPPGQHIAIWVRRTVIAGAAAHNADRAVIRLEGETAA